MCNVTKRCSVWIIVLIAVHRSCFAGGSIGWQEVHERIAKDDLAFLAWVEQNFDIRHAGGAIRVGHDQNGNSTVPGLGIGDRLPPFEFPAKPKGAAGDYTLDLTFNYSDRDEDHKPLWQVTIRRKLRSE